MTSRLSRLSTLGAMTTVLLLGACGNKNEAAAEATAAEEQAQADSAATATDAEAAPQAAPVSFWPALAPVLAGAYTAKCMQPPEMKTVEVAIKLASDGRVSAAGINGDLSKSNVVLNRDPGARTASVSLAAEGSAQLQLWADPDPEASKAVLLAGEQSLSCTHVGGMDALVGQPLHTRLATLLDTGDQKMTCVQTGNLLNQHDRTVRVGAGLVTIGDQKYELAKVESESLQLSDGSNDFSYAIRMPGGQHLSLAYNAAGKIVGVLGVVVDDKKFICTARD